MRHIGTCLVAIAMTVGVTLESAAWGAGTAAKGSDTAYNGSGQQYGAWSVSNKRFRLKASPTTGMATNRCMDAMLDWDKGGLPHFDSRVVRSCLPGVSEETDPGGNGFWTETDPAFPGNIFLTGKGWGYVISDSTLAVQGWEHFDNAGSGSLYSTAPGTGTQGYARVRTRCNNGTVLSCNPLPATSSSGSGGCS